MYILQVQENKPWITQPDKDKFYFQTLQIRHLQSNFKFQYMHTYVQTNTHTNMWRLLYTPLPL